jgi:hypothetical protein
MSMTLAHGWLAFTILALAPFDEPQSPGNSSMAYPIPVELSAPPEACPWAIPWIQNGGDEELAPTERQREWLRRSASFNRQFADGVPTDDPELAEEITSGNWNLMTWHPRWRHLRIIGQRPEPDPSIRLSDWRRDRTPRSAHRIRLVEIGAHPIWLDPLDYLFAFWPGHWLVDSEASRHPAIHLRQGILLTNNTHFHFAARYWILHEFE